MLQHQYFFNFKCSVNHNHHISSSCKYVDDYVTSIVYCIGDYSIFGKCQARYLQNLQVFERLFNEKPTEGHNKTQKTKTSRFNKKRNRTQRKRTRKRTQGRSRKDRGYESDDSIITKWDGQTQKLTPEHPRGSYMSDMSDNSDADGVDAFDSDADGVDAIKPIVPIDSVGELIQPSHDMEMDAKTPSSKARRMNFGSPISLVNGGWQEEMQKTKTEIS